MGGGAYYTWTWAVLGRIASGCGARSRGLPCTMHAGVAGCLIVIDRYLLALALRNFIFMFSIFLTKCFFLCVCLRCYCLNFYNLNQNK